MRGMEPDAVMPLGCNCSPGRPWGIAYVTLHHMAGDLDAAQCDATWRRSGTSAHYSVDRDGRVVRHVADMDRAWACGDGVGCRSGGNDRSISIEHANSGANPWTVHAAAVESGARLTAALCLRHGLGRPQWMVNVFPHSHWSATACPGELAGSQNAAYMRRAGEWYDSMAAGAAGEEDEVTEQDMERIADMAAARVWGCTSGKETYDRVRRGTQLVKIMCGMSADSMAEPKDIEGDVAAWTIGRLQRCTAMLKGVCGIGAEDMDATEVQDGSPLRLSDGDVDRIARRVAELAGGAR